MIAAVQNTEVQSMVTNCYIVIQYSICSGVGAGVLLRLCRAASLTFAQVISPVVSAVGLMYFTVAEAIYRYQVSRVRRFQGAGKCSD